MDEMLVDPLGDRVMKQVPMIAARPLGPNDIWTVKGGKKVPNIDKIRKHLLREGHFEKPDLVDLVKEAAKIFSKFKSCADTYI